MVWLIGNPPPSFCYYSLHICFESSKSAKRVKKYIFTSKVCLHTASVQAVQGISFHFLSMFMILWCFFLRNHVELKSLFYCLGLFTYCKCTSSTRQICHISSNWSFIPIVKIKANTYREVKRNLRQSNATIENKANHFLPFD